MAYIEIKHLYKRYQTGDTEIIANNDINFTIEKGELVIILGASGAGKSTILNILGGMDSGNEGQVLIDGTDIAKYSPKELTTYRRNDVGFVFQFYNLVPNLTAKENVELASEIAADAEADTAVFIHESIYPRLRFVDILLRHFIKSIEVHCEIEVVRIPRSEDILLAEVQAGGAGYHDEHHGNEDADRGKTRSVALHAVDHRGHGDEVVGLIVIAPVFLQNAAQQH